MEFVRQHRPALVATVGQDGIPNVATKSSLTVLDPQRLVYADLVEGRTSTNLRARPEVAVVVMDENGEGYQIKGRGRTDDSGTAFNYMCETSPALRVTLPHPRYVFVIEVDEVSPIEPQRRREL